MALFRQRVNYSVHRGEPIWAARFSMEREWASSTPMSLLFATTRHHASFPFRLAPTPPGRPPPRRNSPTPWVPPHRCGRATATTAATTRSIRRAGSASAAVQVAPNPLGDQLLRQPSFGATFFHRPHPEEQASWPSTWRWRLRPARSVQRHPDCRVATRSAASRASAASRPARSFPSTRDLRGRYRRPGRILEATVLHLQHRVPVPQVGPAKLLAFFDFGNAYYDTQSFNVTNIRSRPGRRLRIFLPIFQAPLRFIYSFNLHPVQPIDQYGLPILAYTERTSGFDFSIGRTF